MKNRTHAQTTVSIRPIVMAVLLGGVTTATQSATLDPIQVLLNQLAAYSAALKASVLTTTPPPLPPTLSSTLNSSSATPPTTTAPTTTPPATTSSTPSSSTSSSTPTSSSSATPPPKTTPTTTTPVQTAFVDRFESITQNASILGGAYVSNAWGGHQTRITEHSDGTIRLLYLSSEDQQLATWHVMRRTATGGWKEEATGLSTDDAGLVRHIPSDTASVVAWPNGISTIFTSPSFTGKVIPGNWEKQVITTRHYGNIGISSDGTLCQKTSRELPVKPQTSVTNTEYSCGTFSSATGTWNWQPFISHSVGPRHAYDYLFPNPDSLPSNMLFATSTSDLYKTASDVPTLDLSLGSYVFNGIRFYSTGINSDASWSMPSDLSLSAAAAQTAALSGQMVIAPTMRLQDSFIDSKGRIFSSYFANDPVNTAAQGLFLAVANKTQAVVFQKKWTALPNYGFVRVFEDAKNRLWLLWSNRGSFATQVRLYPIIENTVNGLPAFTIQSFTDLGGAFSPYAIYGNFYLAVPRGGNSKSLYVNAIYNTCTTTYQTGKEYQDNQCYKADNSGKQRVFYTRIRLPD